MWNLSFPSKSFLIVFACAAQMASAQIAPGQLPSNGVVAAGQAAIAQQGNQMTVNQSSQSAVIDWQSFNIGANAGVNFAQPNASAVALNRVGGQAPSSIYGSLNANGQVFLVNPNGVLFAPGAQVDVGGLVASSLDIANQNFLNGDYRFDRNGALGAVVNEGDLSANYVAMLAPEVINNGIISARMVAMAGGDAVSLNLSGNQLIDITVDQASIDTLVENRQLVKADNGQVIMSAQSANGLLGRVINSGTVEANGIVNDGGVIRLVASDSIELGGSISANAGVEGNGGSIIAIADLDNLLSTTEVTGELSAQGGSGSGNGGFVETSGSHVQLSDSALISTLAAHGLTGNWLLDPTDFTVAISGGDMTGAALSTQLASNNVTLQTTSGSSGTLGNLYINDAVSWSTNNLLTLNAQHDIVVNAPITSTGGSGAGVALEFGQNKTSGDFTNDAQYVIRAPISLTSSGSFSTKFGSDGAAANFTVITDETALAGISSGMTSNYVLGTDITLSGNWTPLGGEITVYDGTFDGLGHTVSGLTYTNTTNDEYVGLFGQIGDFGVVTNLGIISPDIAGAQYVGGLAGVNNGSITNSYVSGGTVTGSDVVGADSDSTVGSIGGLVGHNLGGIAQSYSSATVTATTGDQQGELLGGAIGGLVGSLSGTVSSSYATGSVSGITDVGGFVGWQFGAIDASYSTGAVSGSTNVGGFSGKLPDVGDPFDPFGGAAPGLLVNTFWDTQTSGLATSADDGTNSSTGLTTAQAMQASSYGSWDPNPFYPSWIIREGSVYPLLRAFLPPLTVLADDQIKTYDGNVFGGTYTASLSNGSQVNSGASVTGLTGSLGFAGDALTATDANDYTITPNGLAVGSGQHGFLSVTFANGTLTINPAVVLPVISGNLVGSTSKVYDGNTDVTGLTQANFELTGWVDGEGTDVFVTETAGVYDDADAGSNKNVTVSLDLTDFSSTSTNLSNYTLPTSVSGNIGEITRRPITATLTGTITRDYDRTTDATVGFLNYSYDTSNFVGTDGAFLGGTNSWQSGTFDNRNAGSGKTITVDINPADYVAVNTTNLSNYIFVDELTGVENRVTGAIGTITPLAVTFTAPEISKVYDGTVAHTTATSELDALTAQLVAGDSVTDATIAYADKNASTGDKTVEISAFTISDGNSGNNYNVTLAANNTSTIERKEIISDFSAVEVETREYDGTTDAAIGLLALYTATSGYVEGEGVLLPSLNQDFFSYLGTYDAADASDSRTITLEFGNWIPIDDTHVNNADPNNYIFPTGTTAIGTITPKALTIDGTTAAGRAYDGTTTATVTPGTLQGLIGTETLNVTATGQFSSANAGVQFSTAAYQLFDGTNGGLASNYSLEDNDNFTYLATITPKVLSISGTTAADRVYDGTTTATITPGTLVGLIGSETLGVTATGIFDAKDAGSRTATATYQLQSGNNGGLATNYSLASTTGHAATINPRPISFSGISFTRDYDGTNVASVSAAEVYSRISGFVEGESLLVPKDESNNTVNLDGAFPGVFDGTNAGDRQVTINFGDWTAFVGSTDPNNYDLPTSVTFDGSITPKALSISGTSAAGRGYDGTAVASITPGSLGGLIGSEQLGVTATGLFDSANAGSRVATATYSLANGANGGLAANYSLAQTSGHGATITPRALTINGTTLASRAYDGTTSASFTPGTLSGLIGSQTLVVSATGAFDSRNAGSRSATANYTLANGANGGLASNYSLASTGHTATISPRAVTLTALPITKVYDGSTAYSGAIDYTSLTSALGVAGDSVTGITLTYQNANAGTGKGVNASAATINDGNGGNNYSVSYASANVGTITPKPLTISGTTAAGRVYNGTTTATFNPGTLNGLIGNQTLNVSATGEFGSANAGTQTASATYRLANGSNGGLAANYSLASTSGHSAVISPAALTITANNQTNTVGATFNFTGNEFSSSGLFSPDSITRVDFSSEGATRTAALGDYAIRPSNAQGNGLSNYSINYVNGNMNVIPPTTRTLLATLATLVKSNSAAFQHSRFLRVFRQEVNRYGNISTEAVVDRLMDDMADNCFGNCVNGVPQGSNENNLGSDNELEDFRFGLYQIFGACGTCQQDLVLSTWYKNYSTYVDTFDPETGFLRRN